MNSKRTMISDFIRVKGRYKRSANLEKDFYQANQNGEYIVTPTGCEVVRRLSEGMGNGSPFRAWTLTGPYGAGKSAFAVFLTSLFSSKEGQSRQARYQLGQADPMLSAQLTNSGLIETDTNGFLPILITARRAPASKCLAEGIISAAASIDSGRENPSIRLLKSNLESRNNGQQLDSRLIVEALSTLAESTTSYGYKGILIIVDELGKLFEYAARYPQRGDVYVLQELAEHASRSAKHPIVLIGLLHQSFQEYGVHLDMATRREWAKIQGRFEDIAFLEPIEQVLKLIAKAITWTSEDHKELLNQQILKIFKDSKTAGLAPPGMSELDFENTILAAYPLHPVTLVALPYIFRRFAQNERSLFSYLSSLEPFGFQEFIKSHKFHTDNPYMIGIGDLFDYFTKNFGAGLYRHPHALRWMEAADVLDRKDDLSSFHREVVKTIGVLNALGEFCHLKATEEIISIAITNSIKPSKELSRVLKDLKDASIVTYRKFNRTYRIWEGSDIDLDERIAEGERKIRRSLNLALHVKKYMPPKPLVARRHSFQTGALRYFQFDYVDSFEEAQNHLNVADADGKVIVCLSESPAMAESFSKLAFEQRERQDILFAIPQFIGELRAIVVELGALRWVWENTPGLRDDRVARREMSLRISDAEQMLQRSIEGLLDPRDEPKGSGCLWIHRGRQVEVVTHADVSQLVSEVCDKIYAKSPRIRNELIVRRSLSSAAVSARRNLVERMLNRYSEETLGIDGYPPERSMYESVLKATGLHRQDHNGEWGFFSPGNRSKTKIVFAWNYLKEEIFHQQPEPIAISRLFENLGAPPLGVMPGLHPVLLCAFMLAFSDETTLYREGTFLPEPSIADFEVLMRRPELYAFAGSRVRGGRAAVVKRFAKGLGVNSATVPVVRALFKTVNNLPGFAWNTKRLPKETLALREVFLQAKSPEQFLFLGLPQALGIESFSEEEQGQDNIQSFFDLLNHSLEQLADSTESTIENARDTLLKFCGFRRGSKNWNALRNTAVAIEAGVTDPKLLTFIKRVIQSDADSAGIESVIALVANRPPRNWADMDVDRFPDAAAVIGKAFRLAVNSASITSNVEKQFSVLSQKEQIQAENLFNHMKEYLEQNTNSISPRALRAAVTRMLEELENE